MNNKLAHFFSYILHPLLMPTYGYLILLFTNTYINFAIRPQGKMLLISLIAILTFVLPSSLILMLKKANYISNIELDKKEERTLPFIIVSIFYFITFFTFKNYQIPSLFYLFILSGFISLVLTLIINLFWKISAHMIGIGSLTAALIAVSIFYKVNYIAYIVIFVILSGILGASRLKLEAHKPSQIYIGFAMGFFSIAALCGSIYLLATLTL